jgi:hypothetical protein
VSLDEGVARLKLVNAVLKITPKRGPADDALARLVHRGGLLDDVTFGNGFRLAWAEA